MINNNFKRGIEILSKYAGEADFSLAASHDVITFCTGNPPSDEDQIELLELGWHRDGHHWKAYI